MRRIPGRTASRALPISWAYLLVLANFGPYLFGHVQTGEMFGLLSALALFIFGWSWMSGIAEIPVTVFVSWLALYAVIVLATIWPAHSPGYAQFPRTNALGAYGLPLGLLLLTGFWRRRVQRRQLMVAIASAIVAAGVLNAVIAVIELLTGNAQGLTFLQQYWSVPGEVGGLAASAASNGRYVGIFYQPAEAGVVYGIALFCWVYLLAVERRYRTWWSALACTTLLIGGLITASKVFLLGALPIFLVLIALAGRPSVRALFRVAVILTIPVIFLNVVSQLAVLDVEHSIISRLIPSSGSLVGHYSAGRYGSNGSLGPLITYVLHISPLVGFGSAGLSAAYDSMWVETLVVAGLIGVVIQGLVFIFLTARLIRSRRALARPEWLLGAAVLTLTVGASFGIPTLTGNRISILLWLIIGTLFGANPRVLPERAWPWNAAAAPLLAGTEEPASSPSPANPEKHAILSAAENP